ncbi:hypothetical protein DRP43_02525 [candidate division TA06 bacterium]|uniref:Uncharacterized protein n=1 Tax=candidate division TA06 bacterium TaxID=2250710 RepID=A0A660SKN5_UNCT6|nr:MAG: hypothetical protein DRP43_02525 [candidate division TA06 bacterium]
MNKFQQSVPKVNTFGIVNYVSNAIALHNKMVYKLLIYFMRMEVTSYKLQVTSCKLQEPIA